MPKSVRQISVTPARANGLGALEYNLQWVEYFKQSPVPARFETNVFIQYAIFITK